MSNFSERETPYEKRLIDFIAKGFQDIAAEEWGKFQAAFLESMKEKEAEYLAKIVLELHKQVDFMQHEDRMVITIRRPEFLK